jgi:hypothetical protein
MLVITTLLQLVKCLPVNFSRLTEKPGQAFHSVLLLAQGYYSRAQAGPQQGSHQTLG